MRQVTFLVLFCLILGSCTNRTRLYTMAMGKAQAGSTYDAIVVPGIPYDGQRWDTIMQMRVLWAMHLYKMGVTENIIFSGSSVYTPYVESKVMALHAIALGADPDDVFVETEAEHSTENVFNSGILAHRLGFERVALATDPFQNMMVNSFRKRFMRQLGLPMDRLPVLYNVIRQMDHTAPRIDPSSAYVEEFTSLPDREGFWKRLNGTFGGQVDWEAAEKEMLQPATVVRSY